ncbi:MULTISPECIES: DUF262 domain-containing protein [unclassified Mesorhizobium]|uniref:GmrSD restriction endonuclease domain-containing protein n=1 Tax=unclassified Mesorhizobium TaxID=325217 RepID=UPI00112AD363|nr:MULTISPECIES: DUF262 domain-containing protein [unclassified Mesorhizobium]MBZ9998533.1 DUF262 domain-containing protein [Mesorhizobium sp. B264B2A]MCA0005078.1 DUF262 domain-containing protein [Mesorhizobium sp. B264B1B]MCA0019742.1 DUF262 domain-containing protein [Mesorhizobium sp. B264B1A]TPJ45685.1 DUF262 domain-containing protein [Mesorhizobium sp. B2-6-6]
MAVLETKQTSRTAFEESGTHSKNGAILELKLVGDICGRFLVAKYQRGYRWGKQEVGRLLNDIWESNGVAYNLQPIVVKRIGNEEWELVDGQQRLTTLYLIFHFMQREGLQNAGPAYSIAYETRPGSQTYLQELDQARSESNIDFFHLHAAFQCIREWFDAHGARRQHVANKFYGYLFDSVRVIWYDAPFDLDSPSLFTRLNVGRIPLTDAELVKALLLSRSRGGPGHADRTRELAAQWDGIERDLRQPDVWAFITDADEDEYPTRISLLLDTLAGGALGPKRPRFYTFDNLREKIEATSPQAVWNQVVDLHATILGWFEDRNYYHKIGFLVAVGQSFGELVTLAANQSKGNFVAILDSRICDTLDLSPSDVTALSYETDTHKEKCARLLLLMNVETVRRLKHSTERYSFREHRDSAWSLEHIHAQNAESLTKAEQWKEWLRLHRDALTDLPSVDPERRRVIIGRIDAAGDQLDRNSFQELVRDVTAIFSPSDTNAQPSVHSVHSVTNLALLSGGDNSAIGNSVFEVKRRQILDLDRNGAYIPLCTRQVFLKYYTDADAQQIHFWSVQDRESYLRAMISPEQGILFPYLKLEDRQS